jgi:squalene monooxygenase
LAKQGKKVLVVEASMAEPDRIVGELLQPFGVESLKKVGLSEALEGYDAQPTYGYGILLNHHQMEVKYEPAVKGDKKNIPEGRGFHNGKLLMKLREIARREPNVTMLEANVSHIMRDGHRITGIRYTAAGVEGRARAHLTVVADGCFSKFRGLLHDAQFEKTSSFVGLIMRDCNMPVPGAGHVILAKPSPVIFYPITKNEVRMLIDFPKDVPVGVDALKTYFKGEFSEQIPACMKKSFLDAVDSATTFPMMPNRKLDARPNLDYTNVVLLGDSLNMRHPTTGGGMSVGFSDMVHFATALAKVDCKDHGALNGAIRHFYKVHGKEVQVINILADALYGVFKSEGFPELQFGCFQYLAKGGDWARGPVLFLSGYDNAIIIISHHIAAVDMRSYLCVIIIV